MEICYYGGGDQAFLCEEPLNCVMVWHEQLAGIVKNAKGGGGGGGARGNNGIDPRMLQGL